MHLRRFISRSLLCLAIGLLTSVGVAWYCAAFSALSFGRAAVLIKYRAPGPVITPCRVQTGRGLEYVYLDDPIGGAFNLVSGRTYESRPAPHWSEMRNRPGNPDAVDLEAASGWPLRCLYWRNAHPPRVGASIQGAWNIHGCGPGPAYAGIRRPLPLLPIWPGLTGDTALFALAWSPLLLARTLRTQLRLRRNLCPNCAYSRSGLDPTTPCPECGHVPPPPTEPRP